MRVIIRGSENEGVMYDSIMKVKLLATEWLSGYLQ